MQVVPEWWGIGSVTMHPTLQDGWNLTSLDSSVDTKFPETLTAVAGLVTAAIGKGAGGKLLITAGSQNLGPGLYRIDLTEDIYNPIVFIPVLSFFKDDKSQVLCSSLGSPSPPPKDRTGGGDGGKDNKTKKKPK